MVGLRKYSLQAFLLLTLALGSLVPSTANASGGSHGCAPVARRCVRPCARRCVRPVRRCARARRCCVTRVRCRRACRRVC